MVQLISNNKMISENYSLGKLFKDLKADLTSYAKICLKLEHVFWWVRIRIALTFPTFWLIACHRYGLWVNSQIENKFIKFVLRLFYVVGKRILEIITKSIIMKTAEVGPGLCIAGKGGVILGAKKIGRECTIFDNITIGKDILGNEPELGDFVTIGHDTVIYGGIKVGSGAIIKSSTVLTKSVPDNCIVQGNPGRIIKRNYDHKPI